MGEVGTGWTWLPRAFRSKLCSFLLRMLLLARSYVVTLGTVVYGNVAMTERFNDAFLVYFFFGFSWGILMVWYLRPPRHEQFGSKHDLVLYPRLTLHTNPLGNVRNIWSVPRSRGGWPSSLESEVPRRSDNPEYGEDRPLDRRGVRASCQRWRRWFGPSRPLCPCRFCRFHFCFRSRLLFCFRLFCEDSHSSVH